MLKRIEKSFLSILGLLLLTFVLSSCGGASNSGPIAGPDDEVGEVVDDQEGNIDEQSTDDEEEQEEQQEEQEEQEEQEDEEDQNEIVKDDLSLESFVDINDDNSAEYMEDLVEGNTDFAFSFYKKLISDPELQGQNINFSPLSISTAFGMLYAGAKGETELQMASTLSYNQVHEELHPSFGYLIEDMNTSADDSFVFRMVNGVWLDNSFDIKDDFEEILTENYFAEIENKDFQLYPDDSRKEINDWVSGQTNDKIKDLFPAGSIDSYTKMVLANAVYFNASWKKEFEVSESIYEKTFYLENGMSVSVDAMKSHEMMRYGESDSYQVVELEYDNPDVSMLIILPKGSFTNFESNLSAAKYQDILASTSTKDVRLSMPMFKFSTDIGLSSHLKEMGMLDAFNSFSADFSGINQDMQLYVSGAFHKAYIDVNEKGTEAAAATGVVVGATSTQPTYKEMTINKPFMFILRDKVNGSILFLGKVINPTL